MPYSDIYITSAVLDNINEKVVKSVKTSLNYTNVLTEVGTSALDPIIIPDEEPIIIEIPLFENVLTPQYGYDKIDVFSGSTGESEISSTSAYPTESLLSAYNEDDEPIPMSGYATQECMIISIANGIIKKLIEDNKLTLPGTTGGWKSVTSISTTIVDPSVASAYIDEIMYNIINDMIYIKIDFGNYTEGVQMLSGTQITSNSNGITSTTLATPIVPHAHTFSTTSTVENAYSATQVLFSINNVMSSIIEQGTLENSKTLDTTNPMLLFTVASSASPSIETSTNLRAVPLGVGYLSSSDAIIVSTLNGSESRLYAGDVIHNDVLIIARLRSI